jgi:hypothetical protein
MRNRDYEERTGGPGPLWRVALGLVAITVAVLPPRGAAQINTTTVQGTVYRADGTPAGGTLLVSWSAFTTPQNQAVAAGSVSKAIGADGFVSVNLTPNAAALPTGSYYTAVYHLNDGTVSQEYWVVPASASASIATVRAQLQPSTVAVQPISKAYVDSAISSLNGSWLPIAGGTLTGPLNLNGDPAASTQAATKHYADQLAAAQLPLSGGTVAGPLNAKQFEGRFNADQWQSGSGSNNGIAMSLAQCTSLPYACQVLAPALYAQTEADPWGGIYGNWMSNSGTWLQGPPASASGCITDERFSGFGVSCVAASGPSWADGNIIRTGSGFTTDNISPSPYVLYSTAPGLVVSENNFFGTWNFTNNQASEEALVIHQNGFAPSTTSALELWAHGLSNGDHIGIRDIDTDQGGATAGDNEGNEDKYIHMENGAVWWGTINSMTTVPATTFAISAYSVASNIITFTAANSLTAGQTVTVFGFPTSTWLNNTSLVVLPAGLSGTQFEAVLATNNRSLTTESGTAIVSMPCMGPCKVFNARLTPGGPNGILGDGLELIDLTRGDSSGYVSNLTNGGVVSTTGADWDNAFGDSNAHTTTTAAIIQGTQNNLFPMTNVVVPVASAAGFTTASPACIFDSTGLFWECETLTAVNAGANTVTFAVLDQPFLSASVVAQGGMTGMGFEMTADEVTTTNNLNGMGNGDYGVGSTPLRTVWPIMYNVSGDTAYVVGGNRTSLGGPTTRGYPQMGAGGSVTASLSGGAVTSCSASGGSGYNAYIDGSGYMTMPPQLTYEVNSGATPPVLALSGVSAGGALTGCTVISGGAGITSINVTVTPTNSYAVYPMVRSVNVWNPATGAVDGSSIATDQPIGNWQVGDTIEQEHYYMNMYTGQNIHVFSYQGGTAQDSIFNTLMGGTTGYFGFAGRVTNTNATTLYGNYPNTLATPWVIGRGKMYTPQGFVLQGPFGNGLSMLGPPFGRGTMAGAVSVGCMDTLGNNLCATWTRPYAMLSAANQQDGGRAEDAFFYNPTTYSWQLTAGANGPVGWNAYCSETLTGSANGGLSLTCNGKTSTLDPMGNLSLPGAVRAQGGVTGATINGELTVDGTTYTTLNAAWNAAVSQANASGQNQTIRLGPGTFAVTATLAEPTNGACVSLMGSAAPTVTADNTNASTVINVTQSLGGDLFSLQNTTATQAQSCTFRDFLVMANRNANHAFNLQWFRGLYVDDVTVNDTTQDAFYLGEASGTHQANFEMSNVSVSYSASTFTPAGRPNYGLNLQSTVLDSFVQNLLVRNALQAAVYNGGGGTTFELIHGFGYPYSCTTAPCRNTEANSGAADASWATNYEVIDAGSGGNMYFNTYMDSPAIAAFDLKSNGVQINGGHIQWPDTTSFPNATFAEVEGSVNSNLVISNVDCLNMSNTAGIPGSPAGTAGVWISYMGSNGSAPSYSSVSNLAGCGQYVQQRVAARQTAFDAAGNNSSNSNYGSGQAGVTPKVFVTPLSSQANEGGVEVENFAGGEGDSFYSGFSGQASNFAVMADGTTRSTGVQTSAVMATASTALTKANHIVLANASSGGLTLTLPSCYTAMPDGLTPSGMELTILKTDTTGNAVQLATTSGESIKVLGSSATSYALTAAGGLTLACGPDSNWYSTEQIAATASALATTPAQCPAGSYATGIGANGNANCSQSWHFTWYGNFAGTFGTSTNSSLGAIWSPSAAISVTRLDIAVGTAPAGCSTYPVIGIYDSSAATWLKTVTLAAGTYSYRSAVSGVSIAAGHNLSMGVQTAGVGCTTNPGSAQLTMEYTMNQ